MTRASSTRFHRSSSATLLLAGLSAALAGCGGNEQQAAVRLVNEPGKVELLSQPNSDGNQIWTTFTIKASTHPTAIESPGTGGACLVADLNAFNLPVMPAGPRSCTLNADCQSGLNVAGTPTAGWVGYCDIDGDKKCWVRPGTQPGLCNVGPVIRPLDTIIETPHVSLAAFKARYPGPVRWRTVACLNGYSPPNNRDCALRDGGNRREVMGTPKAVP